ncbi:hypothetical protein MMRN_30760 [Mycobacterium marinum]|uniref:YcaO-like family protein n=1 Tax=Mycobacterium marinum TaxID=1781 RepID=UPI000358B4F0|nr:YcaO-like family protein [Mycobacterium marinum]EPQ80609.1 hypothetical protein MMEU_1134 [Mycobacterium marinum str. Europe]WOR02427.1 YcaO-like family protein [Mycobacterium marinum]BBC66180.1 hypothetical protein MMRN_30760 [Mycobacterium marinum]
MLTIAASAANGRHQHGERQLPLTESEAHGMGLLEELGLTAQFRYYGGDPTAWHCELFDTNSQARQGIGFGKGQVAEARVGALYEALEHYLIHRESLTPFNIELLPCGQIAHSALSGEAYAAILADQPDNHIACRRYQTIDGSDTLAIPQFLSNPWWAEAATAERRAEVGDTADYTAVARYSSNNGSAIGTSRTEATVHAINEAIERDALSLFLAKTFVAEEPDAPVALATETLPNELLELLCRVQNRIGRQVWLIDITTDLGVPSTMAYSPGSRGQYLLGSGTSLSRHYSVFRALTELVQVQLEQEQAGAGQAAKRVLAISQLADYPGLQAAMALDLSRFATSMSATGFIDTLVASTPDQHLQQLLQMLHSRGFTAYFRHLHASSNGVTAVHTHIPGLEHFHLITDAAVVPGERGLAAIGLR